MTRALLDALRGLIRDRAVLLVALTVAWLNFLLTVKWAHLSGALNGWKRPWYGAALLLATWWVLSSRRLGEPVRLAGLGWLLAAGGALLTGVFLLNFPPSSWTQLPFYDDWPPRFQATVDAIALLRRGALAGWQWGFLGGYHTSADLTQNLMPVAIVPMTLLGDRLGFHVAHAAMVAALPVMVYFDVRAEGRRDHAQLSAFFACIGAAGMFGTLMPSGDTNSIAGVVSATIALAGSRLAQRGWRAGSPVLAAGLALALYSHAAFFGYAIIYLALEAVYYRAWPMAIRAAIAAVTAALAALPLYVEILRYPAFFITNNLVYQPGPIDWLAMARQIFYNVEILLHPHRWYNDYLSLVCVFLALFVWIALRGRPSRAGFYAWAVLATMALLRLNVREVGYLMTREMHMLAVLAAPPLAWFILERSGTRRLAWALIAIFALYVQTSVWTIPHAVSARDFNPALIDHLAAAEGNLVLLEASPHRDLDSDPQRRTERTPFDIHFESVLPETTGRRYYGQPWDGWHWTPFRGQVVAGGAFRGELISKTPPAVFVAELRKWGIGHLVVWSTATRAYLDGQPETFTRGWSSGRFVAYALHDPDLRSVVTTAGSGRLEPVDALTGRVHVSGARTGTPVIVRMNYFPAWTAHVDGEPVALFAHDGQLAFTAPADGDYVVALDYPRRIGLLLFSTVALVAGAVVLFLFRRA